MSQLGVTCVIWLTSATLTAGWPCDCKDNGCDIYNMGTLMYKSLEKQAPTGNLLISPIGLWTVLMMAEKIANGDTKSSISRVIHAKRPSKCGDSKYWIFSMECEFNEYFWEETSPFWLRQYVVHSGSLKQTFKEAKEVKKKKTYTYTYWARKLSFKKRDMIDHIRNYQPTIYPFKAQFMQTGDITKTSVVTILSLAKLNSKWRYPITKINQLKHQGKEYMMMQTSGAFFYAYDKTKGMRYICLDGQYNGLRLVIVLPDSNKPLAETSYDMIYPENKQVKHLNVSIPKFKFEVEYSLKQVINDINCNILFSDKCDISGMNGKKAPVSQIIQRSIVRIDEDGIMFQSYTIIVSDPSGKPRDQRFDKSVGNKPFMFFLFYDKYLIAQGRIVDLPV